MLSQQALLKKALKAETNHDFSLAEKVYRQRLMTNGKDVAANMGLARTLFAQNDYGSALVIFQRCLAMDFFDPQCHDYVAKILKQMGYTALVKIHKFFGRKKKEVLIEKYLEKLMEEYCQLPLLDFSYLCRQLDFFYKFAKECYEQGKHTAAKNILLRLLEINDKDYYALTLIADIYYQENDYNNSINCYKKSTVLNENKFLPFFRLAYMHQSKKEYNEAIFCYHKSLQKNKQQVACYVNLAVCLNETNKKDKALALLDKAEKFFPKNPSIEELKIHILSVS